MKRILLGILICGLLCAGCKSQSAGVIGGADGPTSIIVGE